MRAKETKGVLSSGGESHWLAAAGGLAGACLALTEASAAPITFNTALPVGTGQFVGRALGVYENAEGAAGASQTFQAVGVLGYGATPRLAIFASAPFFSRNFDGAGGAEREVSGLGDVRIFARYTLLQSDARGGAFRLSPFAGVETPTGESRKADEFGVLPAALQPGSGSLDYFAGVIATWATLDWSLDGQASWQVNRKDGVFDAGDAFMADLALYRRLAPAALSADTMGFLLGGVEINYVDERRLRINGVADPESGGAQLFVSPGLQYARRKWIAEAAVQIPAWRDADGAGMRPKIIVRTGIRVNF